MTNRSKQSGTMFETLIIPPFDEVYPGTERRTLQGVNDRGDLNMPGNNLYVVEAKNCKRHDIEQWWREAEREALNADVPYGVVVFKRHGTTDPWRQWVLCDVRTFVELVHPPED